MTTTVQAIYEDEGILRLLSPLELEKGAQVEITVNSNLLAEMTLAELERNAPDPRRAAEIMAEIAAMPMEADEAEAQKRLEIVQKINALAVSHGHQENASRDHDQYLYGPDGAR